MKRDVKNVHLSSFESADEGDALFFSANFGMSMSFACYLRTRIFRCYGSSLSEAASFNLFTSQWYGEKVMSDERL